MARQVGIHFVLEVIDSRFRGNDNVVMKTHLKKIFELILLTLTVSSFLIAQDNNKIDFENCTFKEFPLYGMVKFVESFPGVP